MRHLPQPLPYQLGLAAMPWLDSRPYKSAQSYRAELEDMFAGLSKYQDHPYVCDLEPLPIVWEKHGACVRYAKAQQNAAQAPAVLLVPSLVNKSKIMDLTRERSFVRWLAEQGINAYLLDWGNVAEEQALSSIQSVIMNALLPALQGIAEREEQKISALGYCMGGTLLAGALSQRQDGVKGFIALATPWDFHAGQGRLRAHIAAGAGAAFSMMARKHVLSAAHIQALFAGLDPALMVHKFARFAALNDPEKEALFVATEDWLNDGLDLPEGIAEDFMAGWALANKPAEGQWMLDGQAVAAKNIDIPTLVVSSRRDKLVEFESAYALYDALPHALHHDPECGHIGMMAGSKSIPNVWRPIADWIKAQH